MIGSTIIAAIINTVGSMFNTISAALSFSTPLLKTALDTVVWFVKKFRTALAVIISNAVVLYAIVPLMVGANLYGQKVAYKKCEPKVITKLRTKYKFIEKTPSKKLNPSIDLTNPLGWWK